MAVDASEARLRFLKKAAYQLTTSAPTVSAALSSSYIQSVIGFEDDLQHAKNDWHTVRREACGACGNILLPGWSSSVSHKSRRTTARKRRSKPQTLSEKMIVFTCSRCERRSVQGPQSRTPKHVSSNSLRTTVEAAMPFDAHKASGPDQEKVNKSANATSKQRKKSRKGGLQAMLEMNKSKSSSQGGLGLDLMDFMQ
jgi:RNase P subunit RPR2